MKVMVGTAQERLCPPYPFLIPVLLRNEKTLDDQHGQLVECGYVTPLSILLLGDIYEGFSVGYSSGIGSPADTAFLMNSLECRTFLLILFFAGQLSCNRATEREASNHGQ
jgi:hypothetical protein